MNKMQVVGWIAFSMAIINFLSIKYQLLVNGNTDLVGVCLSLLLFVCAVFLIGEDK